MTYVNPGQIKEWRTVRWNVEAAKRQSRRSGKPVYVIRLSADSWDRRYTLKGVKGREHFIVTEGKYVVHVDASDVAVH